MTLLKAAALRLLVFWAFEAKEQREPKHRMKQVSYSERDVFDALRHDAESVTETELRQPKSVTRFAVQ